VRDDEMERDTERAGIHAMTFVNDQDKHVIIAFRGSCSDRFRHMQCSADSCFLAQRKTLGDLSDLTFGGTKQCDQFTPREMDYYSQAKELTDAVQAKYPEHGVLLTGHSMGGMLAILVAATQPGVLQAVTVAPSPFQDALKRDLHFTEQDIANMRYDDLYAVCDKYDCLVNTALVPRARQGATTCMFTDTGFSLGEGEPASCVFVDRMLSDKRISMMEVPSALACKSATHEWRRYETFLWQHKPECRETYSSLPGAMHAIHQ